MTGLSPELIVGLAILAGAALGGLLCGGAVYLIYSRRVRAERTMRDLDRREDIYSRFVDQASEIWQEAFETPHDPGNLIHLSALVGRIRLASSPPVLEAAEGVMHFLLEACQRRPADVSEFMNQASHEFMAPLTAFTAACRAERERMLREL